MTRNAYYITTAIAYPNGDPHIGHAYEMVATDAIARWRRLEGRDVFFLTGTDEHGLKMVQTAEREGMTAQQLADRNSARFRELADKLNISNSDFIRTTEKRHHKASQEIWRRMEAAGDIYQSTYTGWYSVRDEAYFDEGELTTDEDSKKYAPTGAEVAWVEEPSYFFRLSAFQDRLLQLYEDNPEFIAPKERRNEIVAFVKRGLEDVSISRTTFDWGIPVPGIDGHVMYVWIDALTNYLTGVGFPDDAAQFQKFWPADLHVIGKDIIRFHTVYWPAFLISAGLPLPKRVFAHGFLTSEGKKMSKSLGNVVDPFELVETFGADPVRYYCLREISWGQDGDWGREKFVTRNNADLANNFGNLAQRSLSMIAKNFDGRMPPRQMGSGEDSKIVTETITSIARMAEAMVTEQLHEAAGELVAALSAANLYFADQAPWGKKDDVERMGAILATTADVVRRCAIAAQAFVPEAAAKVLDLLAVPAGERRLQHALDPDSGIAADTVLPAPEPVFKKFELPKAG